MTEPEIFSLNTCPLVGSTLIEASAGTGKTYAIAGLFIRLLLEKHFEVSQILVMTFTEAATAELRDRIRSKIRETLAAFSGGKVEDAFLKDLVISREETKEARSLLLRALRSFDQAAIFTIHGFCRRVLRDRAFESGSLFDTELITEQDGLKREIIEDFWRNTLDGASPLLVNFALNRGFFPGALMALLPGDTARWNLEILPDGAVPDTGMAEEGYREAFRHVARSWKAAGEEIRPLFRHESLKKNKFTEAKVLSWTRSLGDLLESDGSDVDAAEVLGEFTTDRIGDALKKGASFPRHPFFTLCDRFQEKRVALLRAFDSVLLGWKRALILGMDEGLKKRKKERNVQSFDDLLTRFLDALNASGGDALARSVRERFRAALIDEFQDTDPIQYSIFRTLFGSGKSLLFLIGDPKQAIYGFRGADIFTYLAAASEVDRRYTLDRNWRSTPSLVQAVNALFSASARPFFFEDISFHPVRAGRTDEGSCGDIGEPLKIWFLPASDYREDGREITKEEARRIIPRGVALEIRRLLHERDVPGGEGGFHEGDVAVLVRTNREARIVQEELKRQGLRGVLYSTGSIFKTREALDMERILRAVADPEREGSIRTALATDLFGFRAESLWALMESEEAWNGWLVRFREYRDLWHERGFMGMFRQVMDREGGILRLMAFSDGERRVTNLFHLSEILHREEVEARLTPPQLIKGLSGKRDPETPEREEDLMRLESDEKAVRIVTIHKSKGLQYPVVFCPFLWEGVRDRKKDQAVFFHDRDRRFRPVYDLGSAAWPDHGALAEEEELAELLRLFYVALTRAREGCYLVWGRFKSGGTSAPSYLLRRSGKEDEGMGWEALEDRVRSSSDEDLREDLERLKSRAPDAIALSGMPREALGSGRPALEEPPPLARRTLAGTIDSTWRLASFSSLTSDDPHGPETPDRDGLWAEEESEGIDGPDGPEQGGEPAVIFPRGTKGGTFFHDLLEHYDFQWENEKEPERLVEEKLRVHGFDLSWKAPVLSMMQRILTLPLDPGREDFTLSRIPAGNRLNELEFYFPLKRITAETLRRLFRSRTGFLDHWGLEESIGRLRFSPTRGFLKGFMDLVFLFEGKYYLVDWKSNFLGGRPEDYGPDRLARVMVENRYVLQYTLYTVALNRYLALRIPGYDYETHFGGIRYLFLRGVDPAKGRNYGIFRDRPPGTWIEELSDALVDFPGGSRS